MKRMPIIAVLFAMLVLWGLQLAAQVPFGSAEDSPLNQRLRDIGLRIEAQDARIAALELRVKELEGKQQTNNPLPTIGNNCVITPYHYK